MRMNALWWWIDRWRKSSAFMDMTLEEQGAYRNLLDEATLRGGALPNDERILAKASGDALAWKRVAKTVMARFVLVDGGWRNETLDGVLSESNRRSNKQRNYRNRAGNSGGDDSGNESGNGSDNQTNNEARPPGPGPSLITDLSSPDQDRVQERRAHAREPLALAGSFPRDHLNHAWCSQRGKCVPQFLHQQFVRAVGGDERAASTQMKEFYRNTEQNWPDGPIGDPPIKLWEKEFAAHFRSVAPASAATGNGLSKVTQSAIRAMKEAGD